MLYNYLKDIHFAFPAAFGLFILLPVLAWWYLKKSDTRRSVILVSTTGTFGARSWKNRFRHLPFLLRMLSVVALVLALARPQERNKEERTEGEGIDIVLCMDVSGSMGSRDIAPSRMEAAKEVAMDFVRSRPVDRIGLVIFSGESFTQCPITTDRNTLLTQIRNLESRKFLADGTVIGEGLATAVDRLTKSPGKSKVIILLTDGKEDPPETRLIDPLTALEIAKSGSVKVYTIGMSAGPVPLAEPSGMEKGKRNAAVGFVGAALVQKIATETGGRYFRARDREALKSVYSQIDQMEKSKVETITQERVRERFMPFVLAALGFVFLEIVLQFTLFRKFP
ncbi:MAG: vWA domain-containing protein [Chitinophagaceae bacterium]